MPTKEEHLVNLFVLDSIDEELAREQANKQSISYTNVHSFVNSSFVLAAGKIIS